MTTNTDLNNFNSFLAIAADTIMCNSECQKQREADKLKQKFINAQNNIATAPSQLRDAAKNYITFTKGQPKYNELVDIQLQEKADTIVDNFKENFKDDIAKIKTHIETYNGILINFKNVADLHTKYKKENVDLFMRFKDETNDILTNDRKTYYEDQQIDNLKFFYFYFLLTIYIICVFCFGIFSLMYPSTINWKVRLAIFIGFIILPYFSSWILGLLIGFFYFLFDLLPKNVAQQI